MIFKTADERISIDVCFDEETVWLALDQISELFEHDKSTISRHIRAFDEGELDKNSVVAKNATTAAENLIFKGLN